MALFVRRVQLVHPCSVRAIRVLSCPAGRERVGDRNEAVLLSARKTWLQPRLNHSVGNNVSSNQSWIVRVQGCGLAYVPNCCLHTQVSSVLAAAKESPKDVRSTGGSKRRGEEQGSVLMQFVEKEQEPKALTVGAKGELSMTAPCWDEHHCSVGNFRPYCFYGNIHWKQLEKQHSSIMPSIKRKENI